MVPLHENVLKAPQQSKSSSLIYLRTHLFLSPIVHYTQLPSLGTHSFTCRISSDLLLPTFSPAFITFSDHVRGPCLLPASPYGQCSTSSLALLMICTFLAYASSTNLREAGKDTNWRKRVCLPPFLQRQTPPLTRPRIPRHEVSCSLLWILTSKVEMITDSTLQCHHEG